MKQTTSQAREETTFTFGITTSEQNDCTVLYETTVLCSSNLMTFNGIFRHNLQRYMWPEHYKHHDNLHAIYMYQLHDIRRLLAGKIMSYAGFYKQTYFLQIATLVTLTLCIVTSEITETVDAETKTGLLILAEKE